MTDRETATRHSALWAAYGDALGFITELADESRVKYRSGETRVEFTIPWRRKVGGRIGQSVDFEAGTYSDDTQLRLATSRAIRSDGSFDVAAFAKVELPAWANYAIGAGLGSREAASNLSRTSATWYSNFYQSKRASYARGGGNGAAMRVQPHVWAARDLRDTPAILRSVVRNAVCTHGHPIGIVGACFHALTLRETLSARHPPSIAKQRDILTELATLPQVIESDNDLRLLWLGPWLDLIGLSLEDAVGSAISEIAEYLDILADVESASPGEMYSTALGRIHATEDESKGSATKTAVLAAYAAFVFRDSGAEAAIVTCANALGSDTDSIATMAGAMLGVTERSAPKHSLQDADYVGEEASRLASVAEGRQGSPSFRYPDTRAWKPSRAAVDAVAHTLGELQLRGLGKLTPVGPRVPAEDRGVTLAWYRLDFGQTILARVRDEPREMSIDEEQSHLAAPRSTKPNSRLLDLFANRSASEPELARSPATLNDALQQAIASKFAPATIGRLLLDQVDGGDADFVERGVALAATILTAYEARSRRSKK